MEEWYGLTSRPFYGASADEAISQGKVDLVAIGRALLTDPDWALNAAKTLGHKSEHT